MNIREIAKRTGISHTTVSRALNNSPLVAEKTKQRIQQVAQEIGYSIDASAKSLATGIRMTIGMLYPYSTLRKVGSLYTNELIHSIQEECKLKQFDSIVNGYDTVGEDIREITRLVREKKVDGLIVIGHEMTAEAVEEIAQSTQNLLLINPGPALQDANHSKIIIDHRFGGELAYEPLKHLLPQELAFVAQDNPQFYSRTAGFLAALAKDRGESATHLVTQLTLESGSYEAAYATTIQNLDLLKTKKGIFVETDKSAFGVMNALQDNHVRIPDQVALVGYDDVEWCAYSHPSLTTIHQPRTDVAKLAAVIMYSLILKKDPTVRTHILKPTLVQRKST
jgi:LacI family transcriptional regulator